VHLESLGAPIIGDPQYGALSPDERAQPMMLHARRLVIPISNNKPPVAVEAAPPQAMQELLAQIGYVA
jgi:23S rRNA-/tRNA-specific pseudouridylate synthase